MIDSVELKIDTQIIKNNINLLRRSLRDETKIIAVIKANGYGCDLKKVGLFLQKENIEEFAVVSLQEAIELREAGVNKPILILGATYPEDFKYLLEYDLMQATLDYEYALKLNEYAVNTNEKIKVHIKVNTGLNRLGIEKFSEIVDVFQMSALSVEGIYTHFASAQRYEDDHETFTYQQINTFKEILTKLEAQGFDLKTTHIQNSPSILHFKDLGFKAVRCGMILFGLFHPEQLQLAYDLGYRAVYSLEAKVVVIRALNLGDTVGYGRSYSLQETETIGTVNAGYCDGITRKYSLNHGYVMYKSRKLPLVGDIAMSQCFIRIDDDSIERYDTVSFFEAGDLSLYTYIEKSEQTINEFISGLRYSIPRIYQ